MAIQFPEIIDVRSEHFLFILLFILDKLCMLSK